MATTTGGTTYVTSTDLVADYPTASLALANRVDVVASGSMSKKTASYTVTVADILAGTTIAMNSVSATVITLPSTSLVNGMMLNVFSVNTGAVTFTGGTVTGVVNSITSQYTGVSLTYDSVAAVWWCLPFGGSVGAANFTNTATGTYTGYKYVTFTGNGSLVIDRAGLADILVVGGGGAGAGTTGGGRYAGGGGGGGVLYATSVYLPASTITVTIGAGAPGVSDNLSAMNGSATSVSALYGIAGGGGSYTGKASNGGSGGGAGADGSGGGTKGAGTTGQGNAGGNPTTTGGSGGGGANAVGANAVGGAGGAGGAGIANSITNVSVTYGGGGGGSGSASAGAGGAGGGGAGALSGTATAGTVNTGGGGGGAGAASAGTGGAGGSGIVIVRVAV